MVNATLRPSKLLEIPSARQARRGVSGDRLWLKEALLHLVVNAIKFTPSGDRRPAIGPRVAAGGINVAVADTDIGKEPARIARALEPFQVDNQRARR